jgi:hypothetical protein
MREWACVAELAQLASRAGAMAVIAIRCLQAGKHETRQVG